MPKAQGAAAGRNPLPEELVQEGDGKGGETPLLGPQWPGPTGKRAGRGRGGAQACWPAEASQDVAGSPGAALAAL